MFACMYVFQLFDSVSRVKVGNVVEMLGVILRWGGVLVCLRVKSDMIDNVDMNYNGQLIDNITILLKMFTSKSSLTRHSPMSGNSPMRSNFTA